MLSPNDFTAFFREVNGYDPFPWQRRLLHQVAEQDGLWPATLDLPTGSGKTAAIDIAIFHLALEATRGEVRRAPVRIAFVVDRRLVVDDAFLRAQRLANALAQPPGPVTVRVAQQLQHLADDGPPLIARALRGGLPREDDWARTPSQPTVLCSTVDQVGSRLLFRGYGVSDSMKPVHAGLLGSDCLILLDEAHLSEPFRQTLEWVGLFRSDKWREVRHTAPWGVALLTATRGAEGGRTFSLNDADRAHPVLKRRLSASKPARVVLEKSRGQRPSTAVDEDEEGQGATKDVVQRTTAIVREIERALHHFQQREHGATAPAIGVVVNRVARARAVFDRLNEQLKDVIAADEVAEPILMIGPARPVDRANLVTSLGAVRTRTWADSAQRLLPKPLIIVSTQCIEAGADIDLDALITELAPLDALRQRFGRLNRAGRDIVPYAAIIVMPRDVAAKYVDPVYGSALRPTRDALEEAQTGDGVQFGVESFAVRVHADMLAPKADAPVLLPAYLDLLSQTAPIPAADPDISLFLHGPDRRPDAITVVWRADIDAHQSHDEETRRLLVLVSPRSAEAIELPIWAVREWLERHRNARTQDLADVAGAGPDEDRKRSPGTPHRVFRWKGDTDRSRWIASADLRPGDSVIAPTSYGGVDRFGWNPDAPTRDALHSDPLPPTTDVGRQAAAAFAGRRFVVRIAPGLLGTSVTADALAEALANAASRRWQDLRAAIIDLPLPEGVRDDLKLLARARGGKVVPYLDPYGRDEQNRWRGVVFVAQRGIQDATAVEDGTPNTTEDDAAGSTPGFTVTLDQHNQDVSDKARLFAKLAGLTEDRVSDLARSGSLHDLGKADQRFQAWLHYGDPLGPDPDASAQLLAKSARPLPRVARLQSELPDHWRHESLSVRLALKHQELAASSDPDLVLWLVGSHHGYGRPFFPHCDPTERVPDVGPQSLAFDWQHLDWSSLFVRLKARYGTWELARMEAILRLADHRASQMRAPEGNAE